MQINNHMDLIVSRQILERIEELEKKKGNIWTAGWNMPGYMPDSEPFTFYSFEEAREDIACKIETDADCTEQLADYCELRDEEELEEAKEFEQKAEELREAAGRVRELKEEEFGRTIGKYHYWITKGGELDEDDAEELEQLKALIEEVESRTGPEFEYGVTLIAEGYFEQYAQELAEDTGAIEDIQRWPGNCIDWEKAADVLKNDYSSIDFDGEIYWVRS